MGKLERKRAELALLEAEAEFVAKKADGSVTVEDKEELRALRQVFREEHRQPAPGAAVESISSKGKVT